MGDASLIQHFYPNADATRLGLGYKVSVFIACFTTQPKGAKVCVLLL